MRVHAILAIAVLVIMASGANALAVRGPGVQSCGKWTVDHQEYNGIAASGDDIWLMGYITSYNRFAFRGPDIADGLDSAGLTQEVSQYCAAHPLDTIETAAYRLMIDLIARDSITNGSPTSR